jgi:RNA recognition motif-containing protein
LGRQTIACGPLGRPEPNPRVFAPLSNFDLGANRTLQLSKKLYIGNLSFSSTESDLTDLFGRHGTVESVNLIMDRETGRPRGFAFVEMQDATGAQDAIRALDGSDFGGRTIKVNEAQDRNRGGSR